MLQDSLAGYPSQKNNYMKKRLVQLLGAVLGIGLFIFAIMVLHNELKAFHYHDIVREIKNHSWVAVSFAVFFMLLNYAVMSVYEMLGFSYIRHPLPWYKIAFTSFVSYAFSNNVGLYTLSGSAVRYRFYSQWGISSINITRLIAFSSIATFWLGLCMICSVVFLVHPLALPPSIHLPFSSSRIPGLGFLTIVVAVMTFAAVRKQPVRIRTWEFEIPRFRLVAGLVSTACFDWIFCAAILYVLLPANAASFPAFIGIFLVAQVIGLISHVPGGLGVFESMILLMLPSVSPSSVFGSLVAFRIIYYLIPLTFSATILGIYELRRHTRKIANTAQILGSWGAGIIPYIFSVMTFVGGTILLFSGATPGIHHRLLILMRFLPLSILEISHFAGSLIGVALLLLAWGLMRRLDGAYHMTLYMLVGGIVFSLLKGLDYEEALIMAILFTLIVPCREAFYRKTSFVNK